MTTFASGYTKEKIYKPLFVQTMASTPIKLSVRGENVDLEAKEKLFHANSLL